MTDHTFHPMRATNANATTTQTTLDLLFLCGCAVSGTVPGARELAAINLHEVWDLAEQQSMQGCVAVALFEAHEHGNLQNAASDELSAWQRALSSYARRAMLLDAERDRIFSWLDEHKIRHAQLKGSLMKDLYPRLGMRYMADNDFWFDARHAKELRAFMESYGYHCNEFGTGAHDAYVKAPLYNFEPHRTLFDSATNRKWHKYFDSAVAHAPTVKGTACEVRLTLEDFYLHHVCHAAKHLWGSGTGVRVLVDEWVLLQRLGDQLDRTRLDAKLKSLDVAGLDEQLRRVAHTLFTASAPLRTEDLPSEDRHLLEVMSVSGTYGTSHQHVVNNINQLKAETGKIKHLSARYILNRLFPSTETLATWFPILRRFPWMYPAVWLFRLVRFGLTDRRNKLKVEVSALREIHHSEDAGN